MGYRRVGTACVVAARGSLRSFQTHLLKGAGPRPVPSDAGDAEVEPLAQGSVCSGGVRGPLSVFTEEVVTLSESEGGEAIGPGCRPSERPLIRTSAGPGARSWELSARE